MKNIFSLKIQSKILIPMLVLSLTPLTVFAFLFFEQYQNDLENTTFLKLKSNLDLKNEKLTFVFTQLEHDVESLFSENWFLTTNSEIHSSSLGQNIEQNLVFFLQSEPLINEIIITDTIGNPLIEIEESEIHRDKFDDVNIAVDSYFSSDLSGFHYTDVYQDDKGNYELFIVYPKNIDGTTFLIIFEVNLTYVYSLIVDHSTIGQTGEILVGEKLVDGAGFIHPLKYDPLAALSRIVTFDESRALPIREAVQGKSDCGITVDYRSEPIFACWGPTYLSWGIVAKIDQSEVYESSNFTYLSFGLIFIFTTGLIVFISRIVSRGIQKPLIKLQDAFRDFNSGNYDKKITIKGNDEISNLTKSFQTFQEYFIANNKIKTFYQNELELKLAESANFKKALDKSANVSITDKDGVIIYVNDKFKEITKYSESELLGQTHRIIKSDHHPPSFFKKMWTTISKGTVWNGDIKNTTKFGTSFWVKTTIIPFLDKNGIPVQYIAVRTDITNQKRIEKKLIDTLVEIREIDNLKNEFASMVTHELKTPLTPIRGYCEMLKDKSLGDLTLEQLDCIDTIDSNAIHLEKLIGDILDAQKLDMNQMIFDKNKINVNDFLENLTKDLQPMMGKNQIQLNVLPVAEENMIFSDEQRLTQVFHNLIRNAADFVPEKSGIIDVGLTSDEDNLTFFVRDNGIGIPESKQSNIFKKFYQVDTKQTRKHGGTGLGLVVCKGIIDGLGGKIWFKSEEEKGTTFYFSLPKSIPVKMEAL